MNNRGTDDSQGLLKMYTIYKIFIKINNILLKLNLVKVKHLF